MSDIQVDRAGRPMFDADGRKLSIEEREAAEAASRTCRICGFTWIYGIGSHDCHEVKDARLTALEAELVLEQQTLKGFKERELELDLKDRRLREAAQAVVDKWPQTAISGELAKYLGN
jgi:hypothetical protein